MRRCLIVNADDFGRTVGVSAGIVEAHLHGLVSTSTVLINLPGAPEDLDRALKQVPSLAFGLHLNITVGRPCLPAARVPSLVGPGGTFHSPNDLLARRRRIEIREVEIEWRAQLDRFLQSGALLDHLDSHHHVALMLPELWGLCLELARENGCAVRPPTPAEPADDVLFTHFPEEGRRYAFGPAAELQRQVGVPSADHLITRFYGPQATLPVLLDVLGHLPAGVSELMCHPGYVDAVLLAESGYSRPRAVELEALTSPEARQVVLRRGIQILSYRQLQEARP